MIPPLRISMAFQVIMFFIYVFAILNVNLPADWALALGIMYINGLTFGFILGTAIFMK